MGSLFKKAIRAPSLLFQENNYTTRPCFGKDVLADLSNPQLFTNQSVKTPINQAIASVNEQRYKNIPPAHLMYRFPDAHLPDTKCKD